MTTGVIRRRIWKGPGIPSAFPVVTILEAEVGAIAHDFQNSPHLEGVFHSQSKDHAPQDLSEKNQLERVRGVGEFLSKMQVSGSQTLKKWLRARL